MLVAHLLHLFENPLFVISAVLLCGFFVGKLVGIAKLPEISGYILAGLFLGKAVTGIISHEFEMGLSIITEIALGIIALTIGGEFSIKKLARLGMKITVITVIQLVFSFFVVMIGLMLVGLQFQFAILMGAIAAATAPAATVAVVQSLKAKGEFVDYLYGIVALDDAGAVILFGIALAVFTGISQMGEGLAQGVVVLRAFGEVGLSLLLGGVSGILIHLVSFRQKQNETLVITTLGLLLLMSAIGISLHLSVLLVNMTAGAVLINIDNRNVRIFRALGSITAPIFLMFFVIAGAELQPAIFLEREVLLLGSVYIIARAIGKYGGVYSGALIVKTPKETRNYLGLCMLPQAGVALGLALLIQNTPAVMEGGPELRMTIGILVNVILMSIFINELIGPPLSRLAVLKGAKINK